MNRPTRGPRVTPDDVERALELLWQQSHQDVEAAQAVNDVRLFVSGDKAAADEARP